jgi:hypothetical protein
MAILRGDDRRLGQKGSRILEG